MTRFLFALLFVSCNNIYHPPAGDGFRQKISFEQLDTVKIAACKIDTKPAIFETAFFKDCTMVEDSILMKFYAVNIGKINVESGKIISCDPIVMHDAMPFTQQFPAGEFPVQLAIAKINTDERVAFSRIYFSGKPVVKWEFALDSSQKNVPIDGETLYGYGVDAGIGIFIDEKANWAYNQLMAKNMNLWDDVFTKEMGKHYRNTWDYAIYNFEGHNLAAFSTGYGDGTYATYIGFDDQGKPCRLLTDFGLVEWWKKK